MERETAANPEKFAEASMYQYSGPNAEAMDLDRDEAAPAATIDTLLHTEHEIENETLTADPTRTNPANLVVWLPEPLEPTVPSGFAV